MAGAQQSERALRTVLRVNAAFSALSEAVLALGAGPIDDVLGTGQVGLVRLVGVGLMLFAVDLVLVARASAPRRRAGGLLFAVADAAWVVGSIVTVALGWYSGAGNARVLAAAAAVGGFAVAEFVTARRIPGEAR